VAANEVLLVANGDLRKSANEVCWPAQSNLEEMLKAAFAEEGLVLRRAHAYDVERKHGFISSQRMGMDVFTHIDPEAPLVVAEAVWQYSSHLLAGLIAHRGPILTVANWSGQWPAWWECSISMAACAKRACASAPSGARISKTRSSSRRCTRGFTRSTSGMMSRMCGSSLPLKWPAAEAELGTSLANQIKQNKAILGVFDEAVWA